MTTQHNRVARQLSRRLLPFLLKLTVTSSLLGFVFFHTDAAAIARVVGEAEPGLLALAVATLFLNYIIGGLRWWCVLAGLGRSVSPRLLIALFWLGGLMSQVLPNPLGDAVRVSVAVKRGMRLGDAIRSALFERLLMVMALLVLIAATEPVLRTRLGDTAPTRVAWLLLACGVAGLAALAVADRLLAPFSRITPVAAIAALSPEFRRLLVSPRSPWVYATAMLGHLNLILAGVIVGAALALPLTTADYLAIMPVATVATVLPVSIGGWGVREGVLLAVLGAMGVKPETALAFSLLYGACIVASSLPALAVVWLGFKPRTLAPVGADAP